ncbi:P-loop containing nucleoside triphosphate hydrolase protein [Sphaerosporella brunnea]|uniref:Peroxisomal ATPase PEX6 n=1 Tax=Sphaerosporella brunnea TaxID=1250544 RepID=A0A5J5FC97_9PEZI|nr:P-loop containing nucleoside triphosphate hydrolase protein [Sphaerosporella brunnea]
MSSSMSPPPAPATIKPPPASLRKRPKNRPPAVARFIIDELRGDAGFVSEDIWRDVFGFQKKVVVADRKLEDIDLNEEPEDEPLPPTLYLAIAPLASAASVRKWTILPVTLMPTSSQFPSLPPNTVLIPSSMNIGPLADLRLPNKRQTGVLITAVNPAYLESVIVNVRTIPGTQVHETDHDLEDRVKDALSKIKIVHTGEPLRLNYGRSAVGRTARIALTEPVNQGFLKPDTKVVVVKERGGQRQAAATDGFAILAGGNSEESDASADTVMLSDDDDEEDDALEFSTFLTAPSTTTAVSFPSISSTPTLVRNGIASPTPGQTPPKSAGRIFRPQPLTAPVPPGYLHPKPREGDDDEARVFVKVGDLAKLGVFSGDWIKISPAPSPQDDAPTSPLRTAAESVARGRGFRPTSSGSMVRNGSRGVPQREESEGKEQALGRPVRVFSLPESWEGPTNKTKSSKKGKGKAISIGASGGRVVYLSPVLLANLLPDNPSSDVLLSPLPSVPPSASSVLHSHAPAFPPSAKEVTLLRIASPTSTDRALQPSLLLQLKSYFETCRRLVKKGDLIAVSTDEVLARSLYGDTSEDGVTEELLASSDAGRRNCVAWFRVGSIVSSAVEDADSKALSPSRLGDDRGPREDPWGDVVFVDPASTRMVQAGSEKRKVPPTMNSTWENYLGIRPPPLREATLLGQPVQITMPARFISQTQRRLRELIAAATSPRAIKMNLQPIAILVTSTQRDIGKRTLAQAAAADVGVHVFHIDAYDIIADGGAGDTKTEAFLRARVDRALSCGKETCVLLISHIEALTAGRMGEVLKEIVSDLKIVVATTTEVDKLSDTVRNVFTHELEVGAPDEKERAALLSTIVDEKRIRLASDVDLGAIAVKTAALVAGDLSDVLDRAVAASKSRVAALAKRLRKSSPPTPPRELPTIADLQFAGGDLVTAVCRVDFDVAVEAARRNFSDSIGAPRIPNVSWDDVGGLANVKYAVMETIQLPLERPELFAKGMKKRSGILFYGPPGTGKTLLAKAIATEFSLNFFSIKGPELLNMYIGESEANVRRVFQRARDARPCVVFFDELDSVAPKRGNQGDSGGVMDRIVSQLLAELDGMSEGKEGSGGVFVIGATNRPDLLDPALLRPGRFDKMLYLGVSDTHEKQLTILEALTRKFSLDAKCRLQDVAETLPFTYTGADLYALCSDAMLKAITRQARWVDRRIQELEMQRGDGSKVGTAWWFDNVATEEDVRVVVSHADFEEARRELVGSVSAKELEHYQRVREQFEQPDKAPQQQQEEEQQQQMLQIDRKGKGKAVAVDDDGSEREVGAPPPQWEDPAQGDEEDLYGE